MAHAPSGGGKDAQVAATRRLQHLSTAVLASFSDSVAFRAVPSLRKYLLPCRGVRERACSRSLIGSGHGAVPNTDTDGNFVRDTERWRIKTWRLSCSPSPSSQAVRSTNYESKWLQLLAVARRTNRLTTLHLSGIDSKVAKAYTKYTSKCQRTACRTRRSKVARRHSP